MDRMKFKKRALKHLMDMMDEKEGMMSEDEPKIKATIMADSKEELLEGAKKLPEVMSKAEEYMQKRMGDLDKPKKKKKEDK